MDTKVTNDERLAAAHATLAEAVERVATSDDWQRLLRISGSFHRYSPRNQLLLAAQGADGLVASFHTWTTITSVDGNVCRIRKGEKALRVYAPIRSKRRELDEDTGELLQPTIVGFTLAPVFHQAQLVSAPDLPAQPKLLQGQELSPEVWDAVAEQITAAGYTLRRGPIDGVDGPKGVTSFTERTVTVRDDLAPEQALKTQIHELGHVLMHSPNNRIEGATLDLIEVEAESVAYVVCDILGVDAGNYSIPYVANWAGANVELVQATAQRVLATARQIVVGLEAELGIDLRPNPIADAVRKSQQEVEIEKPVSSVGRSVAVTTDEIIQQHLAAGAVNWRQLAEAIPAVESHRADQAADDPAAQAIVLAEAGATADASVAFLRARGLTEASIAGSLTVTVADQLGASSTLYTRSDVERALGQPRSIKPLATELVADLLISAGRHPAAARHLATTSGQPAEVINLMEERLRRQHSPHRTANRRSERGLALIDQWTGVAQGVEQEAPGKTRGPKGPEPPAA